MKRYLVTYRMRPVTTAFYASSPGSLRKCWKTQFPEREIVSIRLDPPIKPKKGKR